MGQSELYVGKDLLFAGLQENLVVQLVGAHSTQFRPVLFQWCNGVPNVSQFLSTFHDLQCNRRAAKMNVLEMHHLCKQSAARGGAKGHEDDMPQG